MPEAFDPIILTFFIFLNVKPSVELMYYLSLLCMQHTYNKIFLARKLRIDIRNISDFYWIDNSSCLSSEMLSL